MHPNTLFFYVAFAICVFIAGKITWNTAKSIERKHFDDVPTSHLFVYFVITFLFCTYLQYEHSIIGIQTAKILVTVLSLSILICLISSDLHNKPTLELEDEETPIAQN